ncbi:DsbA family protein [Actinomyces sp. oral taxon 897]|uniref:DsbA family protein n=1 Tax=Actinomyces sp. oral taxon 897 TaxID=2081702 RepID=UPI0034A015EF
MVVIAVLLTIAIAAFLTRPAAAPGAGPTVSDPVPASPPASTGQDTSPAPATQQTPTPSSPETAAPSVTDSRLLTFMHQEVHRDANDGQARGAQNAPVVMVLYSDFACPFCTLLARSVEPQLADLVSNGTLRIEWRDLAQITPTSPLAAQAGVAAAKQGRFWEFHDAVYAAADPAGHPTYTEDSLVEFARTAGVPDLDRFRTDMTSQETVTAVTQAKQHAHQAGIQGTPFMIINDTYISGYRDADFVRATVLDQAAKVG